MKVLHLVKTTYGGIWAFRLMREQVKQGLEVHVATPIDDGPMIPWYKEWGIKTHAINYSLKQLLKNRRELRAIVAEVKPDIIHSHFVLTTIIMRLALRRNPAKRVFQVPGPLHLEHFLYRNVDILLSQKQDYWIPTCNWSYQRYIKSGIKPNHLLMSYYGGDGLTYEVKKGVLRSELGLTDSDIIIAIVAFMYPPKRYLGQRRGLKGHEDFIDAMSIVMEKHSNVHAVCIGGAWNGATDYESKVIQYGTKKCPRIHFLGTRNNVLELYQDIDIAIHPSHSENLGGAGESLAMGVPTIATNTGGFPDIVIDGITGYLVPLNSPSSIAAAVEKMIQDPKHAKEMALVGQKKVLEDTDVRKTSVEVVNFYKKICAVE